MGAISVSKLSVEEYLKIDRAAELKSEYHDGEMFPLTAASVAHGLIAINTGRRLAERLDNTPCRAVGPIRIRVSPRKFVYPDIVGICGPARVTDEVQDTITNPRVIIEILSYSTANYDYGEKFALYRRLPSFDEFF